MTGAVPCAVACRCSEPATTSAAYKRGSAVIIGKIAGMEPRPDIDGWVIDVHVERAWKMAVPAKLRVVTGTNCHYQPKVDAEYVLFLLGSSTDGLQTRRCLGNGPLIEKAEAARWLGRHGSIARVLPAP